MATLDNARLRCTTLREVHEYLVGVNSKVPEQSIYNHLIDAVKSGAIPPTVFHVWLPTCADPCILTEALSQPHSTFVRKVAIKQLGKWFRCPDKFGLLWEALGKVEGFMKILADLPVYDVRTCMYTIGRAGFARKGNQLPRQEAMTELLCSLYNLQYSEEEDDDDDEDASWENAGMSDDDKDEDEDRSPKQSFERFPNPDKRSEGNVDSPLEYYLLAPACTPEFATWYYGYYNGMCMDLVYKLFEAHGPAFQRYCVESCFTGKGDGECLLNYWDLLRRDADFTIKHILAHFAQCRPDLYHNNPAFVEQVCVPLVRQLQNRRASYQQCGFGWGFITVCLLQLDSLRPSLHTGPDNLLRYAIRFWSRFPEPDSQGSNVLRGLLQLMPEEGGENMIRDDLVGLLECTNPGKRYALLKILLNHTKNFYIDLDADTAGENAKLAKIRHRWHLLVFFSLPRKDAIALLTRLMKVHKKKPFLTLEGYQGFYDPSLFRTAFTIFQENGDQDDTFGIDPKLLLSYLTCHSPNLKTRLSGVERAAALMSKWKKRTAEAEDLAERIGRAAAVLAHATASGSLDLFKKTAVWMRTFNRDHRVLQQLVRGKKLHKNETLTLLTGISPIHILQSLNKSGDDLIGSIKSSVELANSIVHILVETAALSIKDANLAVCDFDDVFKLFSLIPQGRLGMLAALKSLGETDDQIFEAVMEPTIELLLSIERMALDGKYKDLNLARPAGYLNLRGEITTLEPAGERFLDEYAKQRYELWMGHRTTFRPDVLSLPEPWTRGLPIQHLMPVNLGVAGNLPFLSTRAEEIVFMPRTAALAPTPEDASVQNAIGQYIDNYGIALAIYIKTGEAGPERKERARKTWLHVTTELTGDISTEAAEKFWAGIFTSQSVDLDFLTDPPLTKRSDPMLPPHNAESLVQWHPDSNKPSAHGFYYKEKTITVLDHHLSAMTQEQGGAEEPFAPRLVEYLHRTVAPAPKLPSFWDLDQYDLEGTKTQDAVIAAAILSINRKCGRNDQLAHEPFPSKEDVRFPPIYLSDEFLEAFSSDYEPPDKEIQVLRRFLPVVPVELLEQLLDSVLKQIEYAGCDKKNNKAARQVLTLLSQCDRCQAASPFIKKCIIYFPWSDIVYKNMFRLSFLFRLPVSEVRGLFTSMTDAMFDYLRESELGDGEWSYRPGATLRASTVNLIPNLLSSSDAEYVDYDFDVEILCRLLRGARDYEVFVGVTSGLLTLLRFIYNDERRLDENIFKAIEEVVVPRVACLNEKKPPTEEEWRAAEEGEGDIPDVMDQPKEQLSALQVQVFRLADDMLNESDDEDEGEDEGNDNEDNDENEEDQEDDGNDENDSENSASDTSESKPDLTPIFTRILMPIIDRSIAEQTRWIKLLINRANLDVEIPVNGFPSMPVWPTFLVKLLEQHPRLMQSSHYDNLYRYCMMNLDPPAWLRKFKGKIKSNPIGGLRVEYRWFLWEMHTRREIIHLGLRQAAELLASSYWTDPEKLPQELNISSIQNATLRAFSVLVKGGYLAASYDLLDGVSSPTSSTSKPFSRESWTANAVPVLKRAIDFVDSLRTAEWNANSEREPKRLPDTLRIRTRNFLVAPADGASDEDVKSFAEDIRSAIDVVVQSGQPYHDHLFGRLPDEKKGRSVADAARMESSYAIPLARHLAGDLITEDSDDGKERKITLQMYLYLEIALLALSDIKRDPDDGAEAEVARELVTGWMGSPDQGVRERTRTAMRKMLKEHGDDAEWIINWTRVDFEDEEESHDENENDDSDDEEEDDD